MSVSTTPPNKNNKFLSKGWKNNFWGGGELCVEGKPHILVLVMNNPRCGTDIYHTSVFEQAP